MEIEEGTPYYRAEGEAAAQFLRPLDEYCEGRVFGIVLALEVTDGAKVVGLVDRMNLEKGVTLETGAGELVGNFSPEEIAAYCVVPEPPLDRSDELRG